MEQDKEYELITGTVEEIIFRNDENGYTVCDIEADDGELLTAVGIMPYLSEGEACKLYGTWTHHASFGRQFSVNSAESCLPATASEILRYLSSGTIKGIGPVMAKRIVECYGDDTFEVIEKHPDWLTSISGISKKKASEINKSFMEHTGSRSVMMFCRDYFGSAISMKIYKAWGSAAVDIIKKNPYRLCGEIGGVGFAKADEIALSLGVPEDSDERVEGAIVYMLSYNATANGHVYVPIEKVIAGVGELISVNGDKVRDAIRRMTAKGKLYVAKIGDDNACYLDHYYNAEKNVALRLIKLDRACPALSSEDAERFIRMIEFRNEIEYDALQRRAITDALVSGVMVLTGSPGTGKTTVVKALIEIFEKLGLDEIELAAPTGRAAKRMSAATGRDARTIHRLLEMDYNDSAYPCFTKNETNKLEADVIIIDEASMIDIMLMDALLRAIPTGARLILIGDSNQLPSVGAGNVLLDIIESGSIRTVALKEIFRQAKESYIITNAAKVINGEYPCLTAKDGDFFFLPRQRDEAIAATVVDLCVRRLPKAYGDGASDGIQVISPSRKGSAGTEALNIQLQNELNPQSGSKNEYKVRDLVFREGDRVMQTKNNYKLEWYRDGNLTAFGDDKPDGVGIFNGDIGVIEKIENDARRMVILFDDRRVYYDFDIADELEHAYAITVHKSQGSEYPTVIVPAYGCAPQLMTRHLLYTAITRASERVIIVGREDIIRKMVECDREDRKYTGLSHMMRCAAGDEE